MQKRTHLIATLLAELVLRLEGALLGPLVADGLLGLGKVQGWREGAHGYRPIEKMGGRSGGQTILVKPLVVKMSTSARTSCVHFYREDTAGQCWLRAGIHF